METAKRQNLLENLKIQNGVTNECGKERSKKFAKYFLNSSVKQMFYLKLKIRISSESGFILKTQIRNRLRKKR